MTVVIVAAVWVVAALVFALALGPLLGSASAGRPIEGDGEHGDGDLARGV